VLEREPSGGSSEADIAIIIAMVSIIIVLFVAVPVNYNPFRNSLFYIFFKRETFSNKENYLTTGVFIALTCGISIVWPSIT